MTTTATTTLRLPRASGAIEPYSPGAPSPYAERHEPSRTRVAFAAAHVVADPLATSDPDGPARLDWEATLAFRRHLWAHGLRVAEAMDTAQRGMGLGWPATQELIRRSVAEARAVGGAIAAGAGTDHLAPGASLAETRRAYEEQCAFVEGAGAPGDRDGEPRARRRRPRAGRLRRHLRRDPLPAARARDPALARADVRSRAGRILEPGRGI